MKVRTRLLITSRSYYGFQHISSGRGNKCSFFFYLLMLAKALKLQKGVGVTRPYIEYDTELQCCFSLMGMGCSVCSLQIFSFVSSQKYIFLLWLKTRKKLKLYLPYQPIFSSGYNNTFIVF